MPAKTDARDTLLQQTCPTVMAPKFGAFAPLMENGHRFLVASSGLWLELRRPWFYLRYPVCEEPRVALPYGEIEIETAFAFDLDTDAAPLLARFVEEARDALPAEHAAWIIWNDVTRALEYRPCIAIAAGAGGIEYHRPKLEEHESLAIDVHSHGGIEAFFSNTDDEDDLGEVKIAVVFGKLDGPDFAMTKRICALGLFLEDEEMPAP